MAALYTDVNQHLNSCGKYKLYHAWNTRNLSKLKSIEHFLGGGRTFLFLLLVLTLFLRPTNGHYSKWISTLWLPHLWEFYSKVSGMQRSPQYYAKWAVNSCVPADAQEYTFRILDIFNRNSIGTLNENINYYFYIVLIFCLTIFT